jgi:pimeloyl-ACP methyl ester carboxylesterase
MPTKTLTVILVHGTWASSSRWKDDGSDFRRWVQDGLSANYLSIEHVAVEWSGSNRWRAREKAANALTEQLDLHRRAEKSGTEYLVIGHSHGGNIATEAVRRRMVTDPEFPLRGVVCLNTPFLKHELRASSTFLGVWLFFCILIGAALSLTNSVATSISADSLHMANQLMRTKLDAPTVMFILYAFAAMLAGATLLNRRLLRRHDKEEYVWGPRPKVLCLSCADDEAITLLGLLEGIANLPQLLFHPVAFGFALLLNAGLLLAKPGVQFCVYEPTCWATGALSIGIALVAWIAVAITGGLLGSLATAVLFGLSRDMLVESLVSRVLVTYTPLKPANSSFRAIVDLETRWSPAQLLHSRIYQSKAAVGEMCEWILKHSD